MASRLTFKYRDDIRLFQAQPAAASSKRPMCLGSARAAPAAWHARVTVSSSSLASEGNTCLQAPVGGVEPSGSVIASINAGNGLERGAPEDVTAVSARDPSAGMAWARDPPNSAFLRKRSNVAVVSTHSGLNCRCSKDQNITCSHEN